MTRMPKKGKAKGGRRGALTGAERRAGARQRARENIAMKEIAESCDYFREEWSIDCQRAHWEAHRPVCSRVRKRDRRTCDVCGVQGDLNDPPFPTCHCGEWRYCGEACQVEDWGRGHAEECASGYLYREGS